MTFWPSVFSRLTAREEEIAAYVYQLPMRVKFRSITIRDGILLRGRDGWAEFSPFWGYRVEYSARWLMSALDTALCGFPEAKYAEIPINATVPAVPADKAAEIALSFGADTAKVKVAEPGQKPEQDLERLAAVRDALGARAKIRIDINGKWDLQTALELLPKYDRAAGGLEYVEQPCMSTTDLAQIRRLLPQLRIAADESIRRVEDPFLVVQKAAADLIIVKNQPLGGVRAVLELLAEIPLPVVVSSALESSLGLRDGLRLAAALPALPDACGLGTAALFNTDVTSKPLLAHSGKLMLREIVPDLLLAAYAGENTHLRYDAGGGANTNLMQFNRDAAHENFSECAHAPLPSIQVWEKWRCRLAQIWAYCEAQKWISPDLRYRLIPLPEK